ncbi:MAG: hypothetical protein NTY35_11690 [Planctomycetota bacterium]|nr:hypothetical protein [Planctomycetota bacterium]
MRTLHVRCHPAVLVPALLGGAALAQTTERVSVATGGAPADSYSSSPAISADGRFVAFVSRATNLDPADTSSEADVWLRDLATGTTELVSVALGGASGDRGSYQPALSSDGRYVAFTSFATDLVAGDRNRRNDVYRRDRRLGRTERVSLDAAGLEVREHCEAPAISADGRHVSFQSLASNLVAGDTNGELDVYLKDLATGAIERVSVGTGGIEGHGPSGPRSALSADGRFVAFTSAAPDLVAGDTNGDEDVFLRDRWLGKTVRVSVATDGAQADFNSALASMSADGRFVAFVTSSAQLVPGDANAAEDVFLRDVVAATTERVSLGAGGIEGDGDSPTASISADGRYVAFASWSTTFGTAGLPGRAQVYLRDRRVATTAIISMSSAGVAGNDDSAFPAMSADGRRIVFVSFATNLVPLDQNGFEDAFVHDRGTALR